MLVIELFKDRDLKFAPFIHSLVGECAKFYRVYDRPFSLPHYSTMFGVPKRRFLRLLEIWAMKQYQMFIRFNFIEGNVVDTIEVGWEDFNEEEVEYIVLNMFEQGEHPIKNHHNYRLKSPPHPKGCPDASITE